MTNFLLIPFAKLFNFVIKITTGMAVEARTKDLY